MAKVKKYSLSYWVKMNRSWDTSKDLLDAVKVYKEKGEHPEIAFTGDVLEFANQLYLEWMKRGTPSAWYQGFFPTPVPVARQLAGMLDLQPGDRVLDPGCGFGNLAYSAKLVQPEITTIGVEHNYWIFEMCQAIGKIEPICGDFLDGIEIPAFDKVIANPPFGKCYGVPAIEYAFMDKIIQRSNPGTLAAVILTPNFFEKQTKKNLPIINRLNILEERPNPEKTFAPLTNVATVSYLLEIQAT